MITGASGFIGGHVVKFFGEKGEHIISVVRKNSDCSFINELKTEIRYADIIDPMDLNHVFKEVDVVIHCAGKVSDWGSKEDFRKTNVKGTLNVLNAASQNNINQVIITGSISSYGEEDSKILKNEGSPYNSHYKYFLDPIFPSGMNYYRDSKAEATQKAIEFAQEHDLNLTVIEPVWVYGENEFSSGFYDYLRSAKDGIPFLPGCKSNSFHVVYANDLARAYYLAYQQKLKGINRIIIGDPEPVNMDKLYQIFCSKAGIKKPANLPLSLAYPSDSCWS